MADKKISALTAATTLDKTETFPIVQGGTTKKATIAQALAPLTILQSDAGTMLGGVPAYPVDGQVYLLTSLGITGVDHIRTVGIVDANTADFVFNNNCEAYLDGLGVYVPCTYDVATNKLSCVLVTEGIFYGGATPSFVIEKSSTEGTLAVVENSAGDWFIYSTENDFPVNKTSCVVGSLSATTAISFAADMILIAAQRYADTKIQVISTSGVVGAYDYIGADGIRIEIHVNIGNL